MTSMPEMLPKGYNFNAKDSKNKAIFYGVLGMLAVLPSIPGRHSVLLAIVFFVVVIHHISQYLLEKDKTCIQITQDGLFIRQKPRLRKPRFYKWDAIEGVKYIEEKKFWFQRLEERIELSLSEGNIVRIDLNVIDKKERKDLLDVLKQGIEQKSKV